MEGSYDSRKGFAQFQYGYDSAAVAGFQSMAGFLRIFGYPDVS